VGHDLLARGPDYGEVVTAPDEAGVVEVLVEAVSELVEEARDYHAGLVYPVSGSPQVVPSLWSVTVYAVSVPGCGYREERPDRKTS